MFRIIQSLSLKLTSVTTMSYFCCGRWRIYYTLLQLVYIEVGEISENSLESGELSVILPRLKIIDMSEQKYFAPECILLDTECEGVSCASSFELPDSNWIGEKEL